MQKLLIAGLCCMALVKSVSAAVTDTVDIYSSAMKKSSKALVITPDTYTREKPLPVVYLLHGLLGNYRQFFDKVQNTATYADRYNLIIVCPDGGAAGWYINSPVNAAWQYETYISTQVVNWIDSHYKTISNRSGRAIIGASMGGHGAFYIAFKHQDVFGAAGSISGCVDIRAYPTALAIQLTLGSYADFQARWNGCSVTELTYLLTPNSLALMFDCGTDDMFFGINRQLHQKLLDMNIPHQYVSRPGGHTFEYMGTALQYQMLFAANFFKKQK